MRFMYLFIAGVLTLTALSLQGCMVEFIPLHPNQTPPRERRSESHSTTPHLNRAVAGVMYSRDAIAPSSDSACDHYSPPEKSKRPIIPTFTQDDVHHPADMNRQLIDYIKRLDVYIALRQKKEDENYRRWKDSCHFP